MDRHQHTERHPTVSTLCAGQCKTARHAVARAYMQHNVPQFARDALEGGLNDVTAQA